MAEASAIDATLTPDDALTVTEELLDAQNHAHLLGLKLHVKQRDIDAIQATYQHPKDRLLHIIIEFLQHTEPRPTWRAVINALRNPLVDLPALAGKIEAAHLPGSTTRIPTTRESLDGNHVSELSSHPNPVSSNKMQREVELYGEPKEIEEYIGVLENQFDTLKKDAIRLLERSKFPVKEVVYELSTLSATEKNEHNKLFIKEETKKLRNSEDQMELFGQLNCYWTFLSPHLLEHLVKKLPPLADIKSDMEAYMKDLKMFREKTPLDLFCKVDERCFEQPEGFEELVVMFEKKVKPKSKLTLQDIEKFRKIYADKYQLYDFALLLKDQVKVMSFVVTFFVPECIVELLSKPSEIPTEMFQEFGVTKVDIVGSCIYAEGATPAGFATEELPCPGIKKQTSTQYVLGKGFVQNRRSIFENKPTEPNPVPYKMQRRHTISDPQKRDRRVLRRPSADQRAQVQSPDSTATCHEMPQTTENSTSKFLAFTKVYTAKTTDQTPSIVDSDTLMEKPSLPCDSVGISTQEATGYVQKPVQLKQSPVTSRNVLDEIKQIKRRFQELKKTTIRSLERNKISVGSVTHCLKSMSPDGVGGHQMFSDVHLEILEKAENQSMLMGQLDYNMDYLSYDMLEYLANEFDLKDVKSQMEDYKLALTEFRKKTKLTQFCQTQKRKRIQLSPEFREMVAKIDFSDDITLEELEQFRVAYCQHYTLKEFAMMVADVSPGSFIVTWYIPCSIVKNLKMDVPKSVLKQTFITKLTIDGTCVYHDHQNEIITREKQPRSINTRSISDGATTLANELYEEQFVEQPSQDLFCPVTKGLLLQPHLTSCCGKHISEEAATRIKREGGVCPWCKNQSWSTVLNKHFQRQVNSLRVFCRHEDKGCGWQGEVSTFHDHVVSCPMKDGPLITDLMKLPVYRESEESSEFVATSDSGPDRTMFLSRTQEHSEESEREKKLRDELALTKVQLLEAQKQLKEKESEREEKERLREELKCKELELQEAQKKLKEKEEELRQKEATWKQELERKEVQPQDSQKQIKEKNELVPLGVFQVADQQQKLLHERDLVPKVQPSHEATATPPSEPPVAKPRKRLTPYETVELCTRSSGPKALTPTQRNLKTHPVDTKSPDPTACASKPKQLNVQCHHRKNKAPVAMFRGSAATDDKYAYFMPCNSTSVYQYELKTAEWVKLPSCPFSNSGLVILEHKLTAVGGTDGSSCTNILSTLQRNQWSKLYRSMHSQRSSPAVVTTSDGNQLVVIGGRVGDNWATSVELYQVKSRTWHKKSSMPKPLQSPSATLCGGQLNVIGVNKHGYSLPLSTLLSTTQSIMLPSWRPLPTLPLTESTAATLSGVLVVIGGGEGESPVNYIHQLVGKEWVEVNGCMNTGRRMCLVANHTPEKIIMVGGIEEDSVEECVAN